MLLIVASHVYGRGPVMDANSIWALVFLLFGCWHVDAFLAISGWYGIKFSWMKFARLYGLILFYSLLNMAYCRFYAGGKASITGGWFGNTYLMLMLLAPLINLGVEKLCERSRREIFSVWILLVAAMMLKYLPFHAIKPLGTGGFSIVTFAFIYTTARILRHVVGEKVLNKWLFLIPPVLFYGALGCLWLGLAFKNYMHGGVFMATGMDRCLLYDSPHVWLMSFAVLLFFVQYVRIPDWIGRVFCFLSPSIFAVYLIHNETAFGLQLFRLPEQWFLGHTSVHVAVITVLCTLWTFLACLGIDIIRRGVLAGLRSLCTRNGKGR